MSSRSDRDKPTSLGALLASSRERTARLAGTAIDRPTWRAIVGDRIAARTEPGPKRGGELTVFVASAAWAQELSLLVGEILPRLKSADVGVESIRFRVRAIAPEPSDASALKPIARRAPLPVELSGKLSDVADPALRDAIADAAGLWLARSEATSAPPAARAPRAAEARTSRSGRETEPSRAAAPDKRGKR